MRLQLLEADDDDFPELIKGLWEAYETPRNVSLGVYSPLLTHDREYCLRWSQKALLELHRSVGAASTWVKVVDLDKTPGNEPGADGTRAGEGEGKAGTIVGGAQWIVFDKPPFPSGQSPPADADFYPPGSICRDFASQWMRQLLDERVRWTNKPHVYLSLAFTALDYRRRGVGRLFMQYGTSKADALGLESWVNATELGVPLYQHAGFKAVHRINPRPVMPPQLHDSGSEVEVHAKAEADRAEWRRCYEMCTSDEDVVTMFRPVRAA